VEEGDEEDLAEIAPELLEKLRELLEAPDAERAKLEKRLIARAPSKRDLSSAALAYGRRTSSTSAERGKLAVLLARLGTARGARRAVILLRAASRASRIIALREIRARNDPAVAGTLALLVGDERADVTDLAWNALLALRRSNPDLQIEPLMREILADAENWGDARAEREWDNTGAIMLVGRLRLTGLRGLLVSRFGDGTANEKAEIARTLAALGGEEAANLLQKVVRDAVGGLRRDGAEGVVLAAARGLGEMRLRDAAPDLIRLLESRSPDLIQAAKDREKEIEDRKRGRTPEPGGPEKERRLKRAATALATHAALRAVTGLTFGPEPKRWGAWLKECEEKRARLPELYGLLSSSKPRERLQALRELSGIPGSDVIERVQRHLGDPSPMVRIGACDALTQLGARDAVEQIVPLLGDTAKGVKESAHRALRVLTGRQFPLDEGAAPWLRWLEKQGGE